jgi:hypothetical protein
VAFAESPDDVLARIDRETREAMIRAERAEDFRRSLGTLRGRGEVAGVVATVEASGMLTGLDLPDDLSRIRGRELAGDVMSAVRLAQAAAAAQVQQRADDAYGQDSGPAQRMRDELAQRFGPPPDTER